MRQLRRGVPAAQAKRGAGLARLSLDVPGRWLDAVGNEAGVEEGGVKYPIQTADEVGVRDLLVDGRHG